MKIRFNCVGFVDRRGKRELEAARAIEQARADQLTERRWREGVTSNPKEIRRLTGNVVSFPRPSALEQALTAPGMARHQAN